MEEREEKEVRGEGRQIEGGHGKKSGSRETKKREEGV